MALTHKEVGELAYTTLRPTLANEYRRATDEALRMIATDYYAETAVSVGETFRRGMARVKAKADPRYDALCVQIYLQLFKQQESET